MAMALAEELEEEARQKSTSNLKQFQTINNEQPTECSELNTRRSETTQENQDRRNKNRVNAKLADLAGVSTAKVFRYKEILEHGTPEEIEEVESGEANIRPTYVGSFIGTINVS